MEPSLASYLALSGILFTIGATGVIFKRNALGMFMCIELMLNAVNLTFVAFSRYYADVTGQLFVFMVMSVAAAEDIEERHEKVSAVGVSQSTTGVR
jgi:NADH-quinone oxidoreductase subunit K